MSQKNKSEEKRVSLHELACEVADDHADEDGKSEVSYKTIERRFHKLVEVCGGDSSVLKSDGGRIYFSEYEADYIRTILYQLSDEEGLSYRFLEQINDEDRISLDEIHDFIQQFIEQMEESKVPEDEIKATVDEMDKMLMYTLQVEMDKCRRSIDMVEMNLAPVLYTHAVLHARKYREEMYRLSAAIAVSTALTAGELGEFIKRAKGISEDDDLDIFDFYGTDRDSIRREYEERDRKTVAFIKENPEIKAYVERISGMKCENIWSSIW